MSLIVDKRIFIVVSAVCLLCLTALPATGCGQDEKADTGTVVTQTVPTTPTSTTTTPPKPAGIILDPNLRSVTGTPTADEMPALIDLQAKVAYPVMVPTELPGGYQLEKDLIGSSPPSAKDPVGYYSYRYSDPGNNSRVLTFNQSRANARPLSGYYLTSVNVNGMDFDVYWHKTREYLPQGDPVRTDTVGDAETFVVVWKGQFTDAAGQPQELFYSMNTGTWTGHDWNDIQAILAGLKPLSGVGG